MDTSDTAMPRKQELLFLVLLLMMRSDHIYGETGGTMFSEDELKFFASLDLCEHFGGECGSTCPFRFITHKWGVPLCPDDSTLTRDCCIGPPPTVVDGIEEFKTTTPSKPTTSTTEATTAKPPVPEYESCGTLEAPHARKKRIVGGQVADSDTWPWLVAFRSMLGSHTCSGAVIAQRWVITVAHCFKYVSNPSLWRVRVGEYNLLVHDEGERDLNIQQIIMHPGYRARVQNNSKNKTLHAKYVHDIALVRLAQDASTVPICLPLPDTNIFVDYQVLADLSPEDRREEISNDIDSSLRRESSSRDNGAGSNRDKYNRIPNMGLTEVEASLEYEDLDLPRQRGSCWVAGWGLTMDAKSEEQILHEVSGNVMGSEECSQMWGEQLEEDMLCFGDGTYGPCTGDSGGPLACEQEGPVYLVGLVSWGTEDCNIGGYPSVFTNTIPYLSWIHEQMNRYA